MLDNQNVLHNIHRVLLWDMFALWPVLVCCLAKWGGSLGSTQDLRPALATHDPDMSSMWNQKTASAENQLAAEQMAGTDTPLKRAQDTALSKAYTNPPVAAGPCSHTPKIKPPPPSGQRVNLTGFSPGAKKLIPSPDVLCPGRTRAYSLNGRHDAAHWEKLNRGT